jgi:hypothetical protein
MTDVVATSCAKLASANNYLRGRAPRVHEVLPIKN